MRAAWTLLPVIGAPLAHAPVMKFDRLRALKRPIDGGATVRGSRVFGDNKTWRGALCMTAGPLAVTLVLSRGAAGEWWRRKLPEPVAQADPAVLGLLLGASVWMGELPNSFVKRQLGIAPGTQAPAGLGTVLSAIDQFDFVLGAALLLRPLWKPSGRDVAEMAAAVTAVHLPLNIAGKLLGVRSSWV